MNTRILILLLAIVACKTTKDNVNYSDISSDSKFLIDPAIKEKLTENNKLTIVYKNLDMKKEIDLMDSSTRIFLNQNEIITGNKDCLYLLEIFDNSILVLSKSNHLGNKHISGNYLFLRDEIYFFDVNSNKKASLKIDDGFYLYPVKHRSRSTDTNQYFIKNIDFENMELLLVPPSENLKIIKLQNISSLPVLCDE